MISPEVLEQRFAVSADVLWKQLLEALTVVPGATLNAVDEGHRKAHFVTGMSTWSWGENMIARVEPLDDGGALLHVTGQVRHTFLSSAFGEKMHRRGFTRNLLRQLSA